MTLESSVAPEWSQNCAAPADETVQVADAGAPSPAAAAPSAVAPSAPRVVSPRIAVIGVGGAGGNMVNTMMREGLDQIEYLTANTDAQALSGSRAPVRLQLGEGLTGGLGAGSDPEIGAKAAEESAEAIAAALEGVHMCFIAAGMGGGTGTGAAPVIARIAREKGVLTVGFATEPFDFEGPLRGRVAKQGVEALSGEVDALIVIPNQNLFRVANEATAFSDAFLLADEVLCQGVKGVSDLMVKSGLVNLDFADVRAVIAEMGAATMGSGEAEGQNRAAEAATAAVENPLLDAATLHGAKGVLINITGGPDLTLFEVDQAATRVRQDADPDAKVYFGYTIDPEMSGKVRVSVVATGLSREARPQQEAAPIEAAPAEAPAEPAQPAAARPAAPAAPAGPQVDLVRSMAETIPKTASQVSDGMRASAVSMQGETPPNSTRVRSDRIPGFLTRQR